MTKKLAITISGAVSLGSYEAGVAFEILDAVAQHNQWADANKQPDERFEIDVLTGASAGGMSAAIIAQYLLYDGSSLTQPYDNPLYNAWVLKVDIEGLLARGKNEPASHSVLSSDFVIEISDTYLLGRYAKPPEAPAPPQPHPGFSRDYQKLQLGLALSNINGVDYDRDTLSGSRFIYTRHEDQFVREIDPKPDDNSEFWGSVRAAAVACGAFPVAFRVQDLVRNILEFESPWLVKTVWNGQDTTKFTYTDGGVFQNEPLGMAKHLVQQIPGGRLNAYDRGYLYVAPQPKKSTEVPFSTDPTKGFSAATADFEQLAIHLAGSVVGQAQFQDWSIAEGENDKLKVLNQRAGQLQVMFGDKTLTPDLTVPVSDRLLQAIFTKEKQTNEERQTAINSAREQLRTQFAKEYSDLAGDSVVAGAWLDAVLVLERAAGLEEKEEMLIYDFLADPKQLASTGLMAFAGFFDQAYRKHDYDYGRDVAQQKLKEYRTRESSVFANLHWTPKAIDPIDPKLSGLQMSQIDKGKRQQVYKQIHDSADQLLQEMKQSWFERWAVLQFFLNGKIKKLLAL